MSELRDVIAKNICELRQSRGMTQLMLADKLNYSDKAISKWERGESIPDVFMLKTVADLFGVTVDYLLTEDHKEAVKHSAAVSKIVRRNRILISFMATMLVWLIATVAFVTMGIIDEELAFKPWLVFLYSMPLSAVVALIFNSIWGKPKLNYFLITAMTWTLLISVHITFFVVASLNVWLIYVLGIPVQVIIFLSSGIRNPKKKKNVKRKGAQNEQNDAPSTT